MNPARRLLRRLWVSPPSQAGGDEREGNVPLGDSPDVHDEIAPLDLPRDHPGRHEAARQASRSGGVTRGDVG